MQSADVEGLAALHVPGGGPLDIRRLGGGLVNETYRVRRGGAAYALRLAARGRNDLGFDRTWEARVLDAAARADLAPAVVYCDPAQGLLITRWVEGRSWSAEEASQQANIARTAELLRRIHALPLPIPARSMDPQKWIDRYSAAAGSTGPAGLENAASSHLEALAMLPVGDPKLCHSDLHILNLLDRGGSLVLLDWEYAHAADPLWDLAGWSANNDFEDLRRSDLLARYLLREPLPSERRRLQLLCWLYDYVCLLWCTVAAAAPTGDMQGAIAARALALSARLAARASSRAD
jgi:thiamine kinase